MRRQHSLWILLPLLLAACAPRPSVIDAGVSRTLTALVPAPLLPADRPTSTAVPTLAQLTEPAGSDPVLVNAVTSVSETSTPEAPTDPAPTVEAATPTPAETSAATDPTPLGELLFEDTFDSPGLWSVGDASDSNVVINNGALSFTHKTPGSFSLRLIGKQGADFSAQVATALANNCASGDRYGLIVRAQDPSNYYVFQLDCEGRYRFTRYVSGVATPLIDWTAASTIQRGSHAANLLTLTAHGSSFALTINETPLATISDSTFANGRFGLTVGANITKDFTVVFDNLKVNKIP